MRFSTGDVLGRSLTITFKNFLPFTLIALIIYVPLILLGIIIYSGGPSEAAGAGLLIIGLLAMLLGFVVTAAISYGVFQQLRGQRASMGDCLSVGFQRMLPVLGVALVAGICIALGFLALVIPGLILICMLYVAVPVAVVEKPGVFGSLARSADLTKGYRWAVFGIVIVIFVVNQVVQLVINQGAEATADSGAGILILGIVISMFFNLYSAVCQTVAYHDLRVVKEGATIEDLVKVFE